MTRTLTPTTGSTTTGSTTSGPSTAERRAAAHRIRQHFDGFAPAYDATAFAGAGMAHLSRRDLDVVSGAAALALDRVAVGTVPRACDVGVGTGRISAHLQAYGFDVTGVDASTEMLARAADRLEGATLVQGSLADRLPVDDGSADLVTCLRVVKYLPGWRGAIAELARVAAPGGIVCFDLANARSAARFGYPEGMVWPTTHRAALSAIAAAGLDVIEVRPGVHLPDPLWRAASAPATSRLVRAGEAVASAVGGRHGARSWTFVTRRAG